MGAYVPRTPSTFDNFIAVYAVMLPIYIVGWPLNLSIAITFARHPSLQQTKLDELMASLSMLCLFWCSQRVILDLIFLAANPMWLNLMDSVITALVLVAQFGLNLLLAMERMFVVRMWPDEKTSKYYWSVGTAMIGIGVSCLGCIPYVVFTLPTADLDATTWSLISVYILPIWFVLSGVAIISLYTSTFFYSRRRLKELINTADTSAQRRRTRLERVIFLNCVLMAASLFLCYIPRAIFEFTWLGDSTSLDSNVSKGLQAIPDVSPSLEVLLTPALIFYFRRDVRRLVFKKQDTVQSSESGGSDGNEGSQVVLELTVVKSLSLGKVEDIDSSIYE
ncbi:hypothetical protein BC830DRAFT_736644 [Chytriomyces sp. MP71]|nr:hypothetical protein BC830DRAFT_736644 [Chytriomyces sp. MP71]